MLALLQTIRCLEFYAAFSRAICARNLVILRNSASGVRGSGTAHRQIVIHVPPDRPGRGHKPPLARGMESQVSHA